jgi:N-acetylglucosaminyl-diphospho-decaprenol L-rhamnosyltransferase
VTTTHPVTGVADLAIVIVSWNVRDLLRQCLLSLAASVQLTTKPRIEVLLVDNGSSDGTPAMVESEFPWVQLIRNQQNAGFTRANNQALRLARARYVMLLNPDTTFPDTFFGAVLPVDSAIARLLAYLETHPDVGVVGPRLLYPSGQTQSSRRRFPTLATAFFESTLLERFWPLSPPVRRYRVMDRPDDVEQDVDWLVGACLVVRQEAIDAVGLLDEGFFMYSEEVDWCRRFKDAGWRVVFLPSAVVVHHEGKSSEQNLVKRNVFFHESKCRYIAKHHGRLPAEILRIFLLLTFVAQTLEEVVKFPFAGSRRGLRCHRALMLGEVTLWQFRRLISWRRIVGVG